MDVEPFLRPEHQEALTLLIGFERRIELRQLLGEELYGEHLQDRHGPYAMGAPEIDYANRAVSADLHDPRIPSDDWRVVDTVFGCRYLTLADYKGGFILLSLLPGVVDVYVKFDRPVDTSDRPTRQFSETRPNTFDRRNRLQYLAFLTIAEGLVAESEQRSRG